MSDLSFVIVSEDSCEALDVGQEILVVFLVVNL